MPRDGGIRVPDPAAPDAGHVDYRRIHDELIRKEDSLTTQEVKLSSEKQLKALNYRNTIAKRSIEILEDQTFYGNQQEPIPIENLTSENTAIVIENENHFRERYNTFIDRLIDDGDEGDEGDDQTQKKIGDIINNLRRRFIRLRTDQLMTGGKRRGSISRKSYSRHRGARSTKKRGTRRRNQKSHQRRSWRRAH